MSRAYESIFIRLIAAAKDDVRGRYHHAQARLANSVLSTLKARWRSFAGSDV